MRKMTLLIGGAVGYVLGARAGRDQYDKIRAMAGKAKDNPKVQDAADKLASQGSEMLHQAQDKAGALAEKAGDKAPDWVPGSRGTDTSAPVSPATTSQSTATATPTAMSGGNSRGSAH